MNLFTTRRLERAITSQNQTKLRATLQAIKLDADPSDKDLALLGQALALVDGTELKMSFLGLVPGLEIILYPEDEAAYHFAEDHTMSSEDAEASKWDPLVSP